MSNPTAAWFQTFVPRETHITSDWTNSVVAKFGRGLDVKDFGAVGDGVADDTNAVQAFFTTMAAQGGVGYISPGTYLLTSPILLTIGLGWNISGGGSSSTNFVVNSSFHGGFNVFQIKGAGTPTAFRLHGFSVASPGAGLSGTAAVGLKIGDDSIASIGILGYGASEISDIVVLSFPTCWYFTNCRLINIRNCSGWNLESTQNTIVLISQNGSFTGDLVFDNFNGVSTNAHANHVVSILSTGAFSFGDPKNFISGIKFRSCTFYSGFQTIYILGTAGTLINDIWLVDGCQCDQNVSNAVYVESQDIATIVEDIHFDGFWAAGSSNGSMVFTSTGTGGAIRGVSIRDSYLWAADARAIHFAGTGIDHPVLIGNTISDCAMAGAAIEFAVGGASNPVVEGNVCRTGFFNRKPNYFISFNLGSAGILCVGNNSNGAVNTAAILDNSGAVAKTIANNL